MLEFNMRQFAQQLIDNDPKTKQCVSEIPAACSQLKGNDIHFSLMDPSGTIREVSCEEFYQDQCSTDIVLKLQKDIKLQNFLHFLIGVNALSGSNDDIINNDELKKSDTNNNGKLDNDEVISCVNLLRKAYGAPQAQKREAAAIATNVRSMLRTNAPELYKAAFPNDAP